MSGARWATFDCYGTLVDWNAGIRRELERLFGADQGERLLIRYHELEPQVQVEDPGSTYREVMATVLTALAREAGRELAGEGDPELADEADPALAREAGRELPAGERDALARSLPRWPVFPEVREQLDEARRRGWQLMLLSNSDRDLIDASIAAIGVPFSGAIVASEIGSYKPELGHWRAFYESTGAARERHVHVAQSRFHDILPAHQLGIRSVWINRLGERAEPATREPQAPTRELPDLVGLADVLDELMP